MFLTFAMYPPILRSMASAINESVLTQEQIEALSWALERDQGKLEIHGVEEDWMAKVIDYLSRCSDEVRESRRAEIRPGQKQPRGGNLCDCDMHRSSSQSRETKVCGGCRTAIYCSDWCQETDWGRHQSECDSSRLIRQESKIFEDWYSPKWRIWHI
ncbi:hypothetical protein BKA70DRAFT_680468 [Coprinopsis sp. MPI-PUGE-AT-0042]|nr:hypothetical protein BKA70DRAFT_680468 [Coprinopsis sp. MPI-PUGE-AT-0042]